MSLTVKASFSVTGLPEGKGMSLPIMAGCALAVTILTFGGLGSVQNTVSAAEASMVFLQVFQAQRGQQSGLDMQRQALGASGARAATMARF
jgi:hypothetical protein